MNASEITDTPYVAPSIRIAVGQPQWSTTQPPIAKPAIVPTIPATASSVLALSSCSLGTISGVIALFAGRKNTLHVNSRNTSVHTGVARCVAL